MSVPVLSIDVRLFSGNADTSALLGLHELENFHLDHQTALDAFAEGRSPAAWAFESDPTAIQANRIQWGDAGDGVELTGRGLDQIQNLDQLMSNLESGIASGAFDTLKLVSSGQEIARLTFGTHTLSLTSGSQKLTVQGDIPTTFQGIFDLAQGLPSLFGYEMLDMATYDAVAERIGGYDLDSVTLTDGGRNLVDLTLGESALRLIAGGAKLEMTGSFPAQNLGAGLAALRPVYQAEFEGRPIPDLTKLPDLDITGLQLTGVGGATLMNLTGKPGSLDLLSGGVLRIDGTPGADTGVELWDIGTMGADRVAVNLAGGADEVIVDEWALEEAHYNESRFALDGGAGFDVLRLRDFWSANVEIDLTKATITTQHYNGETVSSLSFARFEAYSVEDASYVTFKGNAGDNLLSFGGWVEEIDFDGGAGFDVLAIAPATNPEALFGGMTRQAFVEQADVYYGNNGEIVFEANETAYEWFSFNLMDVEAIRFVTENGGQETVAVQDLVPEITSHLQLGTQDSDYYFDAGADNIILGQSGNDILSGSAASVSAAAASPEMAAKVYRLYEATLDRAPDAGGYVSWTGSLATGQIDLIKAATGFVKSQEFQNTYGALNSEGFVQQLYQNVLGREADAGGLEGWTARLEGGTSRAEVVIGFSESLEFQRGTAAKSGAYAHAHTDSSWSDEVYRLYQASFDRAPDLSGFMKWTERLATETPLKNAAAGFVNSTEFQNAYGALDNEGFVQQLYLNVLDRYADAGGLAGWTARLDDGMSRAEVLLGFSESREFVDATAAEIKPWIRGADEFDDLLAGGSGNDRLVGGSGADYFQLSPGGGHDQIMDFEVWDWLDLRDFDFESIAEARSHMSQSGNNALFAHENTTAVLKNVALSSLVDDNFII